MWIFNESLNYCKFPTILQCADLRPVFEKGFRGSNETSQRFLKIYYANKLTVFADQNLSKYQCAFRKGFSTQYSLVAMMEIWRDAVDNKKVFSAHLIDLSKAFDCLSHELIIAKLNAYGFSLPALKLIHDYLSRR